MREFSIWYMGHDLGQYRGGLGPNKWGYWRLLFPFCGRFHKASIKHDLWFSFGGTEQDKEMANEQFFQDCLNASGKNIFVIAFSCFYFMMVYEFGSKYFIYK